MSGRDESVEGTPTSRWRQVGNKNRYSLVMLAPLRQAAQRKKTMTIVTRPSFLSCEEESCLKTALALMILRRKTERTTTDDDSSQQQQCSNTTAVKRDLMLFRCGTVVGSHIGANMEHLRNMMNIAVLTAQSLYRPTNAAVYTNLSPLCTGNPANNNNNKPPPPTNQ